MIRPVINKLGRTLIRKALEKRIYFQNRGKINKSRNLFMQIARSADVKIEGNLLFDQNNESNNHRSSILRMDNGSQLKIEGVFRFMYGADVILFSNSTLILGDNSYINSDCKIRCHKMIKIGNGCAISHDFTVMDSNAHALNGTTKTQEVLVGDHVWIGTRVTVLPGVKIGNGAIIAAGAVVTHDIPEHALAGGVPARVLKKEVTWK